MKYLTLIVVGLLLPGCIQNKVAVVANSDKAHNGDEVEIAPEIGPMVKIRAHGDEVDETTEE
jgi:hypothetical protein